MDVSLIRPLEAAWARTRRVLLDSPFDLERWLVVGFAAWIARLGENGIGTSFSGRLPGPKWGSADTALRDGLTWLVAHPLWLAIGAFGVVVGIAIGIALLWVSSRGKFVFLDVVLHDRAAIVEPWKRFAREGNSLFVWRLVFAFATIAAVSLLAVPWMLALLAWSRTGAFVLGLAGLAVLPLVLVVVVVAAYVQGFLENFVVPLQYRYGGTTTEAWRMFLPLLGANLGTFLVWGLLWVGLLMAIAIAIAVAGFLTCCVGFLVLAIPYVNAVVLLPVTYTLRGYGPALLAEFGENWAPAASQPT